MGKYKCMKKISHSKLTYLFCFFLLLILEAQAQSTLNQVQLKGQIKGMSSGSLYLAHYFGSDQQVIVDTTQYQNDGRFDFVFKKPLFPGLYMLNYAPNKYFDLIITESNIELKTDTLNIISSMEFIQSEENKAFYQFQARMSNDFQQMRAMASDPNKRNDVQRMSKALEQFRSDWLSKNQKLFAAKLIKASMEPEIPNYSGAMKTKADSLKAYQFRLNYAKKHFFDYLDLNDERFYRSPFIDLKINKYFNDLVVQRSDSIIKEVDALLMKIKNTDIRRFVIYRLSNTYENSKIIGTDGAFAHMAERYYVQEPGLWDTMTVRKVKERLAIIKPLLIGKKIPELMLKTPDNKTLQFANMTGKYTLVVFYDPDCSHCKEEMPKLLEMQAYFKQKNLQVMAVSIVRDKAKWLKFINEYKIAGFYNGIDVHYNPTTKKEEYYTDFINRYDVYSTPTLYLLDQNKRILMKRFGVEDIQAFIQFHESQTSLK